jgi:hypothetical protein
MRRTLRIAGAIFFPPVLQAIFLLGGHTGYLPTPVSEYSIYISAATGFVLLAIEFPVYAIAVAGLYFPLMIVLLIGESLGLGIWLTRSFP